MKSVLIKLCICALIFSSSALAKEQLESQTGDILGESSSDGKVLKGAISYSLGSTGGYELKDDTGYRAIVKYLPHLIEKFAMPPAGPQENPDEVPSTTDYYDGTKHLNAAKIQCKVYSNPSDCLHQSACGWCGATHSCILGNNLGPLQPCAKSSYVFTAPFPHWSPQTRIVNEQLGGVGLVVQNK